MAKIGAREAANIVRSLSLIKQAPPNLVSMVSEVSFAERLVREDGPKGISRVLHGLSETRQGAPALVKLMDRDEVVEKVSIDTVMNILLFASQFARRSHTLFASLNAVREGPKGRGDC